MEMSTVGLSVLEGRQILTSLLIPRPIVWITTSGHGPYFNENLAPFSSVAPVCNQPLMISFSCHRNADGSRKQTALNVSASGEFVVNTIHPSFLDQVSDSAGQFEPRASKFDKLGMKSASCTVVKAPRVEGALASFECTVFKCIEIPDVEPVTDFFIGRIVHLHIATNLHFQLDPGGGPIDILGALGLEEFLIRGEMVRRALR